MSDNPKFIGHPRFDSTGGELETIIDNFVVPSTKFLTCVRAR